MQRFLALAAAALLLVGPAAAQQTGGTGVSSIAGLRGTVSAAQARAAIGAISCPGTGSCAPAGAFLTALQSAVAGTQPDVLDDIATSLVVGSAADLELRSGQITSGGPLVAYVTARYGLTSLQIAAIFTAAGAGVTVTGTPITTFAGTLSSYLDQLPSIPAVTGTAGTGAGQLALGDPLLTTLSYPGSTATTRVLAVLGTQAAPSLTLDAAAIVQKVTAATTPGDDAAFYASIVKTTAAAGASAAAAFFEASDLAGGSGTFMEGIDARCVLRTNGGSAGGGTCGNVALSETDAGVTAFGNLIGLEAGFYFNAGTDQPTFQSFAPNHEVSAFVASNLGTNKADAAFVVNGNNAKPFRTGLLVLGSGVGSGAGVDDTAFATRGPMPVGINLAASTFGTAAMVSVGYTLGPAGDVAAHSFQEVLMTPPSSSTACTAGQFTDDANYHYVCVATNTWKRVALSSF